MEQIMDVAIEVGAEDLESDDDGNIVVWTQPSKTTQLCQTIGDAFGLKVVSSDIIWSPNEETKVKLDSSSEFRNITDLVAALQESPDVHAIWSNAARGSVSEEEWVKLQDNLDV
jgi:transcriptional/translational regulatory protein YebC/TACO1